LDTIAKSVVKSRKTLVITGAGVSCNAGIPDFRSSDGLYNLVKHQYPDCPVRGRDLFDTVLFSSPESTSVFFTFMTQLRKCILKARSTPTHKFIKHLKDKNKLLRCYTQNIDGLEIHEGLNSGVSEDWKSLDVIQLHGDIHSLKCMHCSKEFEWEPHSEKALDKGEMVACPGCTLTNENRIKSGKRGTSIGFLRPNIVLYGEEHPNGEVIGKCTTADLKSGPDCMIILGTSLKVHGIKKLVRDAAQRVKDKGGLVIFVNKTEVSKSLWNEIIDYHIESDCDEWIRDLKLRQPNFFSVQTTL
ncbi:NAD-dependent deacetylase HST3, partial [Nadsonia fulvescens var. elongata DSM 6958]